MSEIAIQDGVLATTLDGDIDDSVTSLDVAAGTGSDYPTAPFPIQCGSENLMVTVVATDTFTVTRGLGDTVAAAHTDGDTIIHVVTAASFPTRKDDTTGDYVMQGDLDLDGNDLIGYTPPAQHLVGLADVDVTSGAIGDSLIFQGSTYTEIVRTGWTAYSDGGSSPAYAIDASTSTFYKSQQLTASVNKSLRIDLGAEEDISRITIIQTNGSRYTTGVNVDVATTGAGISDDWTTVQYFSGLIVGTNNLDLTVPKSARYVRLHPIDNSYSSQWELMDVKAYSVVAVWENEETAFRDDGAGTFEAQGDIDLDGNDLIGYTPVLDLGDLDDVTLTAPATGGPLVYDESGSYAAEALDRTGWVASASSAHSSGLPYLLIDGNDTTRWISASAGVEWVQVDTGAAGVAAARMAYLPSGTWTGAKLEVSDNATDWTEIWTGTITDGSLNNLDFDTVHARYWRLTRGTADWSAGYEINLFALTGSWIDAAPTFIDNAGTFDAQGDINLNGHDLIGSPMPTSAGQWIEYDPEWEDTASTACSAGTGGIEKAYYQHIGRTVFFRIYVELGTSPSVGASGQQWQWTVPLPVSTVNEQTIGGSGWAIDSGTKFYTGTIWGDADADTFGMLSNDQTWRWRDVNPHTWASGDKFFISGQYETDTEGFAATTTKMFDLLHSIKDSADTPDDEFESTTLDAKWTAVEGSAGTVAIDETGEVAKYDLASRPGWLLIQGGSASGQDVQLRQDFTIPDGSCIVAAVSFGGGATDGEPGYASNEQQFGIAVNDSDTSYISGTYVRFTYYTIPDGVRVVSYDGTTILGGTAGFADVAMYQPGGQIGFLRIDRDGLVYSFYVSADGMTWMPIGSKTFGSAPDNLWIIGGAFGAGGEPVPIHAVKWIRQGTGGTVDPWNPAARVAIDTTDTEQYVQETAPTNPSVGDIWVNPSVPASRQRGGAELRLTSKQSIPDVTFTDVDWEASEYDDSDYWEGVTNPERITFPEAGRYHVIVNYHFDSQATGLRGARLIRNGDATAELVEDFHKATDLVVYRGNFACVVNAAAGDYVSVQVYQSNGTALDLMGASGDDIETTRMWVYQL